MTQPIVLDTVPRANCTWGVPSVVLKVKGEGNDSITV
jgi:hypothetical protein